MEDAILTDAPPDFMLLSQLESSQLRSGSRAKTESHPPAALYKKKAQSQIRKASSQALVEAR